MGWLEGGSGWRESCQFTRRCSECECIIDFTSSSGAKQFFFLLAVAAVVCSFLSLGLDIVKNNKLTTHNK